MQFNLLVVDDDRLIRTLLVQLLECEDHLRIFSARDGLEAIEMLSTRDFDLLLTDQTMPMLSGSELIETLPTLPRNADIPVILLSARFDEPDWVNCGRGQTRYFLPKPFDPNQLLEVVTLALEGALARAASA